MLTMCEHPVSCMACPDTVGWFPALEADMGEKFSELRGRLISECKAEPYCIDLANKGANTCKVVVADPPPSNPSGPNNNPSGPDNNPSNPSSPANNGGNDSPGTQPGRAAVTQPNGAVVASPIVVQGEP